MRVFAYSLVFIAHLHSHLHVYLKVLFWVMLACVVLRSHDTCVSQGVVCGRARCLRLCRLPRACVSQGGFGVGKMLAFVPSCAYKYLTMCTSCGFGLLVKMSMNVDKSSTLSGQKLSLSEAAGRKCVQNNMGKGTPAVSLRQPSIF